MSVRFKFKNDLDHHSVHCDGLNISVRDLKRAIIRQKKFGKVTDFDLVVTNVATEHVYRDENELVNKNTTVSVQRAPLPDGQKKVWEDDVMMVGGAAEAGTVVPAASVSSMLNLTSGPSNLSEGDRINNMISSSTELYKEKNWTKYKGQKAYPDGSKAPANWKCKQCFQNHWISECPFANTELKRTTGIPRSFLQPSQERVLGAKIDPQGHIVVNEMEAQAYSEKKVEKSPWVADDRPAAPKIQIPDELVCKVCNEILTDAVMMPCCADAACDECAREGIIGSDNSKCPLCQEAGVSPEDVIPYRLFRDKVSTFQNQTGYSKQKKQTPMQQQQSQSQFMDLKPTLPDIVLPDPNDVKFNTLIKQKGNTQEIKAPNLDFSYTSKKDNSELILPELFSSQQLFANSPSDKHIPSGNTADNPIVVSPSPSRGETQDHSPSHNARHESRREQSPPSSRHEVGREHTPQSTVRHDVGDHQHSSPQTVASPHRNVSPTPASREHLVRSREEAPPSPGDDPLAGMGQRLREEKERLMKEMTRSPQHLAFTRRAEDRPSPFMDKRSPSPASPTASRRSPTIRRMTSVSPTPRGGSSGGGRRTEPLPPLSPSTTRGGVVSPTQRREVVSPTRSSASQRPLTPTRVTSDYGRHDIVRPLPGLTHQQLPPHSYYPPPAGAPPVQGGYPGGSIYTSSAMEGYIPPKYPMPAGSDVDPLTAFNRKMEEIDRAKHRRRSPGGPHHSPPRAYRERRARSRDRYYREKERRRTPDRYRYKHRSPPPAHPGTGGARSPERRREEAPAAAAGDGRGGSGWKDKENTPVESEPRYTSREEETSVTARRRDEDTRYREEVRPDSRYRRSEERNRNRYDDKERRQRADDRYTSTDQGDSRRSEASDRRHEVSSTDSRRGGDRRGGGAGGGESSDRRVEVTDHRRPAEGNDSRDYDSRRGAVADDRYSSRSKKAKYEERYVVGDTVKVDRFGFHTREYKASAGERYREEDKYREGQYERERRKSDGRRNNETPSLSPSPGSGSRLGAILYEDDVQKNKGKWEIENGAEERRDKRSKKSKKKSRDDDDTEDEAKSKKRKHKKKKKKRDESAEGEGEKGEEGGEKGEGVEDKNKEDAATDAQVPTLVAAYDSQEEGKPVEDPVQDSVEKGDHQVNKSDNFVKPADDAEKDIIPRGFKNSFSEVPKEKPPAVVLPTLVFDSTTTQLVAKKEGPSQVAEGDSRLKSRSTISAPQEQETEQQDILDFTLRTDLSPSERLDVLESKQDKSDSADRKDLLGIVSSSPPPATDINTNREIFEPDNPLVKNEMSPDFKSNLHDLKSQMQQAKSHGQQVKQEEDVKLKVAEPDSTIDSALLVQQASLDQELGVAPHLETKSSGSTNILKKALNNIKDVETKQTKKKKVESVPEVTDVKPETEKKKKKKKNTKKSDSEDSSNQSEDDEEKDQKSEVEEDEEKDKEDGAEDKEESDSDQEEDDKRKKKKKKAKKKKKKQEKKMLSMLKKMNKDDLLDIMSKGKKKKKKKKKKQESDSEEDKEKSVSKDKKRHRSSATPDSPKVVERRSGSRKRRAAAATPTVSRSPSPPPPAKASKRRERTESIHSEASADVQVVEQKKKKSSVKDRLGKRREDSHSRDNRRRQGSVRLADFEDERHVKIEGKHFQISLENRKSSEREEKKGKLSSVVQKRIDSKKERVRSRSRDRHRDSDRSSRHRR